MIAVITGDIVSSRSLDVKSPWIKRLKYILERSKLRKAPKWGVFRGDGFQVELSDPSTALEISILILAGLRSMSREVKLNARIGIGIGEKGYSGTSVNDSNGEAYQLSGSVLDSLKNKTQRVEINTPWPSINKYNIALRLASVIIDQWTFAAAEVTWLKLSGEATQEEMAKKLKISQPAVHKRLSTAHYDELESLILFFEAEVIEAMKNQPGK